MSGYPPGASRSAVVDGPALGRIRCRNVVAVVLDYSAGEVAGGCGEAVCDFVGRVDFVLDGFELVGECPKCGGEIRVREPGTEAE